jgi:hypothetical protein
MSTLMKKLFTLALAAGIVLLFSLPVWAGSIYLSDSAAGGTGKSVLYNVLVDSGNSKINLTTLVTLNYEQVDAIALTPRDDKIYFVDKNLDVMGYYDISANATTSVGTIKAGSTTLGDVVLAAFSPGGVLYVANQADNKLYTVNLGTAAATLVGTITGATVLGNDLAFDSAGNLYFRSNTTNAKIVYKLTLPVTPGGNVTATAVGGNQSYSGTGLIFLNDGAGNLLVSKPSSQDMSIVDKTSGNTLFTYSMYLEGNLYTSGSGDLTGTLVPLPSTVMLLGSGLFGLGLLGWRRKRD